jgi:hypothetical protein
MPAAIAAIVDDENTLLQPSAILSRLSVNMQTFIFQLHLYAFLKKNAQHARLLPDYVF